MLIFRTFSAPFKLFPCIQGRRVPLRFMLAPGYYISRLRRFTLAPGFHISRLRRWRLPLAIIFRALGARVFSLVPALQINLNRTIEMQSTRKTKMRFTVILLVLFLCIPSATPVSAKTLHHFVFFGMDREKLQTTKSLLDTKAFEGAQVAYFWRQLEPGKDEYDFSLIREDLAFLNAHGKKLWVQIQDVSFSERWVPVPKYLIRDPRYHGGANRQYVYKNNDEEHATAAGWAARRWDPAVQDRFHKLLFALAKEFDGRIEGINLAESSVDFGYTGRLYPDGFTPGTYRDALVTTLKVLKQAFSKSIALQYANFMPGEWRPSEDKGYLRAIYKTARETKAGVGGPDLLPYQRRQMGNSYELIREVAGEVPVGIAVQDGNYDHINPKTGKRVTVAELIEFATEYLKAD